MKMRKMLSEKRAAFVDEKKNLAARNAEILAAAEKREDSGFTDAESQELAAALERGKAIDTEIADIDERIARLDEIQAFEDEARDNAEGPSQKRAVTSVNEPDLYREGSPNSFFRDVATMRRSPSASDRVMRHQAYEETRRAEERAANVTGDFADGLVIPQYLVADFAPVARESRVLFDIIGSSPLPEQGMTATIPRGNTGTIVSSQTTQNTALNSRTYTTSDLTIPLITMGAFNDLSRQLVDRGAGVDRIVMEDIVGATSEEEGAQGWNGSGANNQHFGVLNTTDVSTVQLVTQTAAASQLDEIVQALSTFRTERKRAARVIFMHPRRWGFLKQAKDSTGRPLLTHEGYGPFNTFGTVIPGNDYEAEIAGRIDGLPVILDATIPTTLSYDVTVGAATDAIFVTRPQDYRLWEDSIVPNQVMVEPEPKSLTDTIVAWKYQMFSVARYTTATLVIAGSALDAP